MDQNLNIEHILKILPHRYPFLLIDRVLTMDPIKIPMNFTGRKIHATKNVTFNEPFFTGHFPNRPLMPGVLMVEAMAQASAIMGCRAPDSKSRMEMLIVGIDNARFRQPVIPGDTLHIYSECVKDRGSIMSFHCEVMVEGKVVAEADILAKQFPIPIEVN